MGWTGAGRISWLDHTLVAALGFTIGRNNSLVLHTNFWLVYQGLECGEGEVAAKWDLLPHLEQLTEKFYRASLLL